MDIQSQKGKGTTVEIVIPAILEEDVQAKKKETQEVNGI